jgi:predicted MFS family arabinose efflux permease
VSLFALAMMGAFALASAFAPDWYVLAALRFGVGAGAAFFFAPALGLVASYFPAGSRGPVIGLYNAGFSAGAALGLLLGAAVGVALGWAWALGLGGAALLLTAPVAAWLLPSTETGAERRRFTELVDAARPVLRSRRLWCLALALTGVWGLFFIVAQDFVDFAAIVHPSWPITLAAALPTIMILVEIVGGPVGGWLGERARDMRLLLGLFSVGCCAAAIALPFLSLVELVAAFVFLGFGAGLVFAILYLIPSYDPVVRGEGFTMALALLNCVQILGGSALAVAFGFIAVDWGFTWAWVVAGIAGLATLPLLVGVSGARPSPVVPSVASTLPPG